MLAQMIHQTARGQSRRVPLPNRISGLVPLRLIVILPQIFAER